MALLNRRAFIRVALASSLTTLAARGYAQTSATNGEPVALRIGYQKSSTLITLLKARGSLDKALAPLGVRVSWNEFSSGLP
jgi:sulfonate transport system substrate-binding protein